VTADTVDVKLRERSYDIVVTSDDPAGLGSFARQRCRGTLALLVTDAHAATYAAAAARALVRTGLRVSQAVVAPGERHKSLGSASRLYDHLARLRADRSTTVVAVGGGMIGDLAGFVAATYSRGLALLMVPTTLLAMVDSSVGGKVGVNHPNAKNLIGAFHQPVGVWIDTAALATLPDREYRSGLAEVVKYGVALDGELFAYLEANRDAILARAPAVVRHVIARCCRLKADVVERDEREENGRRATLNYGHTFAHAYERVSGYGTWRHGEAVAFGMVQASRLAERRGLIPRECTARLERLLTGLGLPVAAPRLPTADLLAAMHHDKKTVAGHLRFVLPHRLGEVGLFDDVANHDLRAILEGAHNEREALEPE